MRFLVPSLLLPETQFSRTTEGGQLNLILDRGAAVSQLEQARVDQTAVVPGSYGPSPCPNVTALVQFGIAAFFFVAGSRGEGFLLTECQSRRRQKVQEQLRVLRELEKVVSYQS